MNNKYYKWIMFLFCLITIGMGPALVNARGGGGGHFGGGGFGGGERGFGAGDRGFAGDRAFNGDRGDWSGYGARQMDSYHGNYNAVTNRYRAQVGRYYNNGAYYKYYHNGGYYNYYYNGNYYRYYNNGAYYNYYYNGAYYNYFYNGAYYNYCKWVPKYWANGYWHPAKQVCW